MTDLEITKLCAEAMGYETTTYSRGIYARDNDGIRLFDPLHDDAQCFALVKKFEVTFDRSSDYPKWTAHPYGHAECEVASDDLNRAICECVAKMMGSKKL